MKTLDLSEAAHLLKLHPQTVLQRARSGDIPAAKPGKCWVFIEQDLIEWLRSQYTRPWQDVGQGGKEVCSLKDQIANSGGIALPHQTAQQYANLLKLKTKEKPKN
ncbi:MAG: DNA-binding protein [Gammaproteobacteria bacterium HGW-Gammaproteobacteria-3]|nr:MAG: DNA-binding protein [Gammaproteobacteria bacterium HGW-Gammaproteobacteria-3]